MLTLADLSLVQRNCIHVQCALQRSGDTCAFNHDAILTTPTYEICIQGLLNQAQLRESMHGVYMHRARKGLDQGLDVNCCQSVMHTRKEQTNFAFICICMSRSYCGSTTKSSVPHFSRHIHDL